ncbi:DeoR/GlpR family DNA-binding transcription regulator [Sphingobacterium daejeonense]|uniref:DeoR/GlpR family DNA-binding transcription regulator n=1 Tax=Sphingobacterium daejeonense TaxID=371142 RepID=UPI0021A7CABE|nr:DeoR/GlpR family DNA-binding transcription regulator [Sphingobacterium daejeonense]MCT1530311.1 DeoR/GlpR family DNA-binding transcription regulator [Sphingobacterium daejeonense]
MMNITDRHEFILKSLKEKGKITIDWLCETMKVSSVTIRKDLKVLEDKNLLFRIKGGASSSNPYAIDRPIIVKESINSEEKQRIAQAAIKLIKDNDSIMIGSGTTVFTLAKNIETTHALTVITPALKVSLELSGKPNIEVLLLGGLIRPNSSSVAGQYAMRVLDEISCGILFLGADGIDLEFGISISNLPEATLNQKMIETSQKIAILADSSKFGKRGLGKICELIDVDYIITDSKVSPNIVKSIEDLGIKIIVA